MRKLLKQIKNQRRNFRGVFVRMGTKPNWHGYSEETVLLEDIIDVETGQVVTDHIWFNYTKAFQALGDLSAGDVIYFTARVRHYLKGYKGYDYIKRIESPIEHDWKLSYPTRLHKEVIANALG